MSGVFFFHQSFLNWAKHYHSSPLAVPPEQLRERYSSQRLLSSMLLVRCEVRSAVFVENVVFKMVGVTAWSWLGTPCASLLALCDADSRVGDCGQALMLKEKICGGRWRFLRAASVLLWLLADST